MDWQAVVDHVRDDAMMGLREKGASSLRHQWQREGLGPGGRAALRVALSRLPPHVMSAPTMRRQGDNTPSNALCALYDASASVFTKNSARLRTLRHVPQASSVGCPCGGWGSWIPSWWMDNPSTLTRFHP